MQALCCVRRSREVRQLLATKAAMLENLQHILHQIQMAETNVMVRVIYALPLPNMTVSLR